MGCSSLSGLPHWHICAHMGYFPRFLFLRVAGQDVELTDVVGAHMSCPDVPCKLGGVLLPFCNLGEMWLSFGTGEVKSLKSHKTLCIQSNCLWSFVGIWGIYLNKRGVGGGSKLQG